MEETRICSVCGDEFTYNRKLGNRCVDCWKKARKQVRKKSEEKTKNIKNGIEAPRIKKIVDDVEESPSTILRISPNHCFGIQKMIKNKATWKEILKEYNFLGKETLKAYVKRCRKPTKIYTEEV